MSRTAPRSLLLLLAAAGVALGGCRGGSDRVGLEGGAGQEPPSTTATSTAPPSTTVVPTTTTTRPAARTTTTALRRTTTTAARPKPVVPQQGQQVVAVYVATGPSLEGPSFTRARARLSSLGYTGYSGGDTACNRGATEALPQLQEYSLSVEFASRADAQRFADLYGPVLGIASVSVYCAD